MEVPVHVGIIGCGAIAPAYLQNLKGNLSQNVEVVACSDIDAGLAREFAKAHSIPKACSTEKLLKDPEIEMAVNLTPAPCHYEVSRQILDAGKHLFSEKPLSLDLESGADLLKRAECKGLKIAGAADTFLGAGLQVARRVIEQGRIGDPVAVSTMITIPFHVDRRYHEVFRGAVLDLGPYYVTALVHLFGPVVKVAGLSPLRYPEKTDGGTGETFAVDLPSTACALMEFDNGLTASFIASQDVHSYYPRTEIMGTRGRMVLCDANFYSGAIELENFSDPEVIDPSADEGYIDKKRGLGVAELARAIRKGSEPLANGALMYHVLEALLAVFHASESGTCVNIESSVAQPRMLKEGEIGELRKDLVA